MNFRLWGILLVICAITITACSDQDKIDIEAFNQDRMIANYLLQRNLTLEPLSEGLYLNPIHSGGNTVKPQVSEFVLVDYYIRNILGDAQDGSFVEINDSRLNAFAGISPLLKYGGPRLMQVGGTSKDPGLSLALKTMSVGDSVQLISRGENLAVSGYNPRTVYLALRKIITSLSQYQTGNIYQYMDSVSKDRVEKILLTSPSTGFRDTLYRISYGGAVDDSLAKPNYKVKVDYTGTFLNGVVFDEAEDTELTVLDSQGTGIIFGFNEALMRVRRGETIRVIIPYSLGYGTSDEYSGGQITIPALSPLVFVIKMKEFVSK